MPAAETSAVFQKGIGTESSPAKPTRVRHPLVREMLDRRARSRNGILSRGDDRTCCELLRSILPNSLVDHETGILSDCQGISQFAPLWRRTDFRFQRL